MYRLLGLDALLPRSRYRGPLTTPLFHVVMARIANPDSKRGSVRRLEEDFGVSLPLEKVYRMMDRLDAKAIAHLRTRVGEASRALFAGAGRGFCSSTARRWPSRRRWRTRFRQHGFSKDGKHRDAQVLLALMVSRGRAAGELRGASPAPPMRGTAFFRCSTTCSGATGWSARCAWPTGAC